MTKSERLKILRMLSGYTQEELAQIIHVPRSALSIWENPKKYGPSEESVPRLAEALNVPPGYLTYGDIQLNASVWTPQLPARKHHQQLYMSDLKRLLPHFLRENKFISYLTAILADGAKCFLLSRKLVDSDKLLFDTLLFANSQIKDAISMSLKFSEIEANEGSSVEIELCSESINDISMISILNWMRTATKDSVKYCDLDLTGIDNILKQHRRRLLYRDDIHKCNNISNIKVFDTFIRQMFPNARESDVVKICELYNLISAELGSTPADQINDKLVKAFSNELSYFSRP